jgi:proteasome accessory factor A
MEDGRELTAIEIQRLYLEQADRYAETLNEPEADELIRQWAAALDQLEREPMGLSRTADWAVKYQLMTSYMAKKGCAWDDPRIALADLQYHDVSRGRGLYYLLERDGRVDRVTTDQEVELAMTTPPQTTRAKVRGDFIKFAKERNRSYTVDWTYLKLNGYWEETILCMDPFASTNKRVDELIAASR